MLPVASAGAIFHANMRTNDCIKENGMDGYRWMLLTRKVPWDDLADDTDGFMTSISELVLIRFDRLSLDLVGPASIIANCTDRTSDIQILRPAESFT